MLRVDLLGKRFGNLTVIAPSEGKVTSYGKLVCWVVKCDCGVTKTLTATNLRSGTKSCGCLRDAALDAERRRPHYVDLSGQRFGRWVVQGLPSLINHVARWFCKCDCGSERWVFARSLVSGCSLDCGCTRLAKTKKGPGYASQTCCFNNYKANSAKRRGLEWGLSREQFNTITKSPCHYCGSAPQNRIRAKNSNGDYVYNGIDRVDSSLGYLTSNVVPCCIFCQRAKMDAPYEQFIAYLETVVNFRGSNGFNPICKNFKV